MLDNHFNRTTSTNPFEITKRFVLRCSWGATMKNLAIAGFLLSRNKIHKNIILYTFLFPFVIVTFILIMYKTHNHDVRGIALKSDK